MSEERARKIKLMLFDVDGVMTDGTIFLFPAPGGGEVCAGGTEASAGKPGQARLSTDQQRERMAAHGGFGIAGGGVIEAKGFNAHDGTGFSLARLGGLKTGLITKRITETVALRARDLKVDHVYQGRQDKTAALHDILEKEKLTAAEVCFVGDDIIDLPVMRLCGLAIAVKNARQEVLREAHYVTPHEGGHGAVRDAIEYVLRAQGSLERVMAEYIQSRSVDPGAQVR